jgi:putative flavoprotein involved in K+ transport
VVIVGGGQAGLAMSRCLTDRSIDHVVIERGEVAHSWDTERWDSLRLLTPNWLSRLPGFDYDGPDPDGYMTAREGAAHFRRYRDVIGAPVVSGVAVERVMPTGSDFRVHTEGGPWRARAVVIASGGCSTPRIPAVARALPPDAHTLAAIAYRNPSQLADERVLVVGASGSGLQIADKLARSGRDVTLAVGEHTRMSRTYRGMDIHWWLDRLGILDEGYDEFDDLQRARRVPSLQLIGSPERRDLDLNSLSEGGVGLVGRLVGCRDGKLQFSGSLANLCQSADLKQRRLLDSIDAFAHERGLDSELEAPAVPYRHARASRRSRLTRRRSERWCGQRAPDPRTMARPEPARPKGRRHTHRRRDGVPRDLRARPSLPPTPQADLSRRRRQRRGRSQPPDP